MIILSEVRTGTKRDSRAIFCLFLAAAIFVSAVPVARSAPNPVIKTNTADQLNDCNWMVQYRGRTYDLSPLTREALSRPIETDLRYALQRVPESAEHLQKMTTKLREARAHTIFASIFISGLVVGRIIQAQQKDNDKRRSYDMLTGASGLFFLASTGFSWKATREAKQELVNAVDAFNEKSPHKIEPISTNKSDLEFLESEEALKP